jgi:hypothetical protein
MTEEDEEFERIEREQARATAWRKRQIEDERKRRCPMCNHLLNEEGKHDHAG